MRGKLATGKKDKEARRASSDVSPKVCDATRSRDGIASGWAGSLAWGKACRLRPQDKDGINARNIKVRLDAPKAQYARNSQSPTRHDALLRNPRKSAATRKRRQPRLEEEEVFGDEGWEERVCLVLLTTGPSSVTKLRRWLPLASFLLVASCMELGSL